MIINKYMSIPKVVKAVKYTGNEKEIIDFLKDNTELGEYKTASYKNDNLHIIIIKYKGFNSKENIDEEISLVVELDDYVVIDKNNQITVYSEKDFNNKYYLLNDM